MIDPKAYTKFYDEVYSQDNEGEGWIQWKGTDVCMDIHCKCGYHGHIDAEFFYYYECAGCGQKYAVGQAVKMIPLTDEQVKQCEGRTFFRDEFGRAYS